MVYILSYILAVVVVLAFIQGASIVSQNHLDYEEDDRDQSGSWCNEEVKAS
jgi:hypothetical protein